MCAIDEAWAGQLFYDKQVQSQADLHRKYAPISDNLLERNNNFSIGHNEPQSRDNTRGINTKVMRDTTHNNNSNNTSNIPLPSMSGKCNFNDNNHAFTISDTLDKFMNHSYNTSNNTQSYGNDVNNDNDDNDDNNYLLNENNSYNNDILQKKFKTLNNNTNTNNTNTNKTNTNTTDEKNYNILQDIIIRLDKLELEIHNNNNNNRNNRNIYDLILYGIIGIIIVCIFYIIMRKNAMI